MFQVNLPGSGIASTKHKSMDDALNYVAKLQELKPMRALDGVKSMRAILPDGITPEIVDISAKLIKRAEDRASFIQKRKAVKDAFKKIDPGSISDPALRTVFELLLDSNLVQGIDIEDAAIESPPGVTAPPAEVDVPIAPVEPPAPEEAPIIEPSPEIPTEPQPGPIPSEPVVEPLPVEPPPVAEEPLPPSEPEAPIEAPPVPEETPVIEQPPVIEEPLPETPVVEVPVEAPQTEPLPAEESAAEESPVVIEPIEVPPAPEEIPPAPEPQVIEEPLPEVQRETPVEAAEEIRP